jgi:hypothetical protein
MLETDVTNAKIDKVHAKIKQRSHTRDEQFSPRIIL